jgi:hypothetical protein
MSTKAKLLACVASAVLPWLVASAIPASAADEKFTLSSVINVPTTSANAVGGLNAFDISFVDPVAGVYVLADRSNASIDVIDTGSNTVINQITPGFVGFTGNNDTSGPDGVLIVNHTELWVGDGNSTIWVLHLNNGNVIDKISTAITPGDKTRADELCYDSADHIILMANDASQPAPFVTFISSTSHAVLGHIVMDGSGKPGTGPKATNGIEQCQWSPRTGKFYLNLPEVNGPGDNSQPGAVLVIDPVSETIERTWSVDHSKCVGPQGMAIGPTNQIALGCNGLPTAQNPGVGSVIISESLANTSTNATILFTLAGAGGNDEVWFNPGDDQYFLANSTQGKLGVADPDGTQDQPFATTAAGSHSVAADPVRNQVYVPGNKAAAFCNNGGKGCIGVFTAQGTDDPSICVGQGSPVISVADEGTGDPVFLKEVCPPRGNH